MTNLWRSIEGKARLDSLVSKIWASYQRAMQKDIHE